MQITIKSVRVIKEGERKDGTHYKWLSVIADDESEKGTEYTTFDQKPLSLGPGSEIEIGNPKTKDGKLSFAKVIRIIREVPVSSPPSSNVKPRNGECDQDRTDARTALMQSIEFHKYTEGETINEDTILHTAGIFYEALQTKFGSYNQSVSKAKPKEQKQVEDLFPEEKPPGLNRVAGIDMDWLKENIGKLHEKEPDKWNQASVIMMVNKKTGKSARSFTQAIGYLDPKQANEFVQEIQKELDKEGIS